MVGEGLDTSKKFGLFHISTYDYIRTISPSILNYYNILLYSTLLFYFIL